MTDPIPSTILYGQALVLLRELNAAVTTGVIKDQNDFSLRLREILNRYERTAGRPLMTYETVVDTEPPLSPKMNRMWNMASHDVSLLQNQVDVLRAATIDVYNRAITDIELAKNENLQIANQLKTLQLYSNDIDPTSIVFSDAFGSGDFIDLSAVPPGQQASITDGVLTLGQQGAMIDLSQTAQLSILPTSNGVPGNNQEIDLARTATSSVAKSASSTDPYYVFYAESNRAGNLNAVNDSAPDTWFEYEIYNVTPKDHATAANLNFKYSRVAADGKVSDFDWSHGPIADVTPGTSVNASARHTTVLKLDLLFDLGDTVSINYIKYAPYGLRENVNLPVFIRLVEISNDGAKWIALNPAGVWVANNPNLDSARIAANVSSVAVWSFEVQTARYIRFHLEQPNSIQVPIGHLWYTKQNTDNSKTKTVTATARVTGPEPNYNDPSLVLNPASASSASLIQHREKFTGSRWAVGIRDIQIHQIKYQTNSIMVTKPLRVGGIVDRIALRADLYVPPSWATDIAWVQFFVSPDGGISWFQISRIQDDFLGIPEIVAFNDPTPQQFRTAGVAYYDVAGTVDTLLLKFLLLSPDGSDNTSTPIVRDYQLTVKRR